MDPPEGPPSLAAALWLVAAVLALALGVLAASGV